MNIKTTLKREHWLTAAQAAGRTQELQGRMEQQQQRIGLITSLWEEIRRILLGTEQNSHHHQWQRPPGTRNLCARGGAAGRGRRQMRPTPEAAAKAQHGPA